MTRVLVAAFILSWTAPAFAFHEVSSFDRSANSGGGAGYYYTGSPRSKGYDCTICHVASEKRIRVELGTELASGRYTPGLIYPINVKLVGEHRGLMSAFNPNTFTAEIVGPDGVAVGSLSSTVGGVVQIEDEGRVAVAEGLGNGETEWRFSWSAPATGAPATLYLAMLDGDGADDPERRFIDPLNDDIAVVQLALCPEGEVCQPPAPMEEETSPAGCSTGTGEAPWWLVAAAFLLATAGRRRRFAMVARVATLLCIASIGTAGCGSAGGTSAADAGVDAGAPPDAGWETKVTVLETFDVSTYNADLVPGEPTIDLAFYVTDGGPIEWAHLDKSIVRAKKIFAVPGVQLRVSAAMRVSVPPDWQELDPDVSDVPTTPSYLETDLYAHLDELGTRLTARNQAIIAAVIAQFPAQTSSVSAANTIHVLTVDNAPISYYEWDGTEWTLSEAPTGGLSFPPYVYADRIPSELRGIITLSLSLTGFLADTKALAHEIGHKAINVSHEGVDVCPTFEANGADLMLYGNGERIPSGAEGRWHVERLMLSPFVYRVADGAARFATAYQDGGVYRDRLYGDYIIDEPCAPIQP